jgi:hypothetical protein
MSGRYSISFSRTTPCRDSTRALLSFQVRLGYDEDAASAIDRGSIRRRRRARNGEKDEAVDNYQLPTVQQREEISWRVYHEIRDRHVSREDKGQPGE